MIIVHLSVNTGGIQQSLSCSTGHFVSTFCSSNESPNLKLIFVTFYFVDVDIVEFSWHKKHIVCVLPEQVCYAAAAAIVCVVTGDGHAPLAMTRRALIIHNLPGYYNIDSHLVRNRVSTLSYISAYSNETGI